MTITDSRTKRPKKSIQTMTGFRIETTDTISVASPKIIVDNPRIEVDRSQRSREWRVNLIKIISLKIVSLVPILGDI